MTTTRDHQITGVWLDDERLEVSLTCHERQSNLRLRLENAFWLTSAGAIGCRVDALRVSELGEVDDAIRDVFPEEEVNAVDWSLSRQLDLVDKETGRVVLSAVGEDWALQESEYNPGGW